MESQKSFAKKWLMLQPLFLLLAALYALAYFICERAGLDFFHCRIASTIGIYCPGCGGSRAVAALFCLRPLSAFLLYPPVPIALICLAVADVKMALLLLGRGCMPSRRFGIAVLIICIGSVMAQCAIKNVLLLYGIDVLGDVL